jgi:hypothetical protein
MRRSTIVFALAVVVVAGTALAAAGFKTAKPAQLVAMEPGVVIDPILSVSDIVPGSGNAPDRPDYQMTGIPDGLGAYRVKVGGGEQDAVRRPAAVRAEGARTVDVLMNHEIDGTGPDSPAGVGTRVSQVTIDPATRSVLDAWYPIDGSEGFLRFCSSTLALIDGHQLYFTGEESTNAGALTPDPSDGLGRGGSSLVLDADTGLWRETRHFGLLPKENVNPVQRLAKAVLLVTEDGDPNANKSQLYAYIAPSFKTAITGRRGSLYVWKADAPGDGDPSTNDIHEGQTLTGRFVPVTQAENANAATLEAAVQTKQAFDFVRLEDSATSKTVKSRVYIADTGALGSQSVRGRVYQLDFDRSDPTRAAITLILDADAQLVRGDPIRLVNPDNMDTSRKSLIIQEDRNSEHRDAAVEGGYGRVLLYDLKAGKITRAVARVNTPAGLRPGEWESSGVINAFDLIGDDWWLLDVQAHAVFGAPQPGPTLAPDSSTGEDGQLLAIKIPNS